MPSSSDNSRARRSETKHRVWRPVIPAATIPTSVTMGASRRRALDPTFESRLVQNQALCVLQVGGGVDHPFRYGAGERSEVREVDQPAQDTVALGLYRMDASHSASSKTSTQAETGQTSAHSAHPEQRSSRTRRGAP